MAVLNSTGTIYYSEISGVSNLLDKYKTNVSFDEQVLTGVTLSQIKADLTKMGPPKNDNMGKIEVDVGTASLGVIASKRLKDASNADASVDCSSYSAITFWIKSSVETDDDTFEFILSTTANAATETEALAIPGLRADEWARVILRMNNPNSDTSIISMGIKQLKSIAANYSLIVYEPRLMEELLGQKSFNITETVDSIDTSDYQSREFREFEPTFTSWTIAFEGHKEGPPPLKNKSNYVIGVSENEALGMAFVGNGFYTTFNPSGNFAEAVQYPLTVQGSRYLSKPLS